MAVGELTVLCLVTICRHRLLEVRDSGTRKGSGFSERCDRVTHLAGRGNCFCPAKAFPAAFFTKAPGLKALAEKDTEAANANVTKALLAIIFYSRSFTLQCEHKGDVARSQA